MSFPIAALTGVALHQGLLKYGEWHLHGVYIIACYVATFVTAQVFIGTPLHFSQYDMPKFVAGHFCGLFGSIIAYRLFFHRLCSIPGPRSLAVSKLAHVFYNWSYKGHEVADKLYQQYGPIVRTGPNEVSIFTPEALPVMHHAGTVNGDLHDLAYPRFSCIFTREYDKKKRKPFEKGLKDLRAYHGPLVQVIRQTTNFIEQGRHAPISVDALTRAHSYDFMGRVVFGMQLRDATGHEGRSPMDIQRRALKILGRFAPVPWLIVLILRLRFLRNMPWIHKSPLGDWWRMEDTAIGYTRAKLEPVDEDKDHCVAAEFVKSYHSDRALKNEEEAVNFFEGNGLTAMVGASDTTYQTMKTLLYHLALYPDEAELVRKELMGTDWSDFSGLESLPYLNGFINESMRLLPAASTFAYRQTSQKGLMVTIDDQVYDIPPNVNLCTSRWTLSRLENAFEQPSEFMPSRWFKEGMMHSNSSYPFSIGPRHCPGKAISLQHMRMFLAALLEQYQVEFIPGTDTQKLEATFSSDLTGGLDDFKLVFRGREVAC